MKPASGAGPDHLKLALADHKIDGLVITHLPNVRYLSGFTGSNGMLLVTPDSLTLITDPRYTIRATQESSAKVQIAKGPLLQSMLQLIKRKKLKKLGFERSHLSFEQWRSFKEGLQPGSGLKAIQGVVEDLRAVKSAAEIDQIRQSVLTNSAAYSATIPSIKPGMTEIELAAELEYQMRRRGAEKPAFDTIVACGPRTAMVHAQPTAQAFGDHEMVLIDVGATQGGYASDMTRMVFLGKPNPKTRKMYEAVLEAQLAALSTVRDGVTARRVDLAARRVLKASNLDKQFVHSTGHGLGLEIHEAPRIGRKDRTELVAGMVITIEPGAYIEGAGGVRIEDTVVVTKNGCEVLTPTTKEMMIL